MFVPEPEWWEAYLSIDSYRASPSVLHASDVRCAVGPVDVRVAGESL